MADATGTRPGRAARISFFTNIPNPYNGFLYRRLREEGLDAEAIFKGTPASEGRPWDIEPEPPDRIAANLRSDQWELRERRTARDTIVLCGSWATPRDVARRAISAAFQRLPRILVWGERMSDRGGPRDLLRRAYFSPPGLDGILAIGSWAVPSYRAATGGRLPIHVFPYTTDSGLEAAPDPSSRPTVGFSGRLIPEKGPEVLLRAVHAMPVHERPALEIVGSGPLGDDLAALAAQLQLDVTFHGEVTTARLEAIRRRWWASITPSQLVRGWVDGWSLVVPEALNSGVPVIASGYVGAAHDLIRDGVNGAIVPSESATAPVAWARAIGEVLAQDQRDLGERARAVGEAFATPAAARWLVDLLDGDLSIERSFIDDVWTSLDVPA